MSEITKASYDAAIGIVREYIRQEITKSAQRIWDDPEDFTREEFEQDGETFEDFLRAHIDDAMEDECPGGVNVDEDLFCNFTND